MIKNRIVLILVSAGIMLAGGFYLQSNNGIIPTKDTIGNARLDRLLKDFGFFKPAIPHEIAELVLFDLNQNPVKLTDYEERIVFLNFFATWCPPCRDEMPAMQKLYEAHADKPFQMIAVSLKESSDPVKTFFKEQRLTFTPLLDPKGEVGRHFRIRTIPTTIILDKKGRVLGLAIGPRDWSSKKSKNLFKHLMNT